MKLFSRPLLCMLLIVTCMLIAVPALAQDIELSETYTFEDGTFFSYPGDWEMDERPTYLKIASDDTEIYIVTPTMLEGEGLTDIDDLTDLLSDYFDEIFNGMKDFDADNVDMIEIAGREAASYKYADGNDSEGWIIAVRFSDETVGIIDSISKDGNMTEAEEVLAVAESFDRGEGLEPVSDVTEEEAEPCMISTSASNTVAIRVGPGTNRTSYAFLPANEAFVVLGQAAADDGSLWWKVDKEAVAPGKSAAEAWIAQDDVDAEGGCDAVGDASAPPVVPIVSAPPQSGGSDPGGQPQAPAGGEIIPQSGSWTVTFSNTMTASCLDVPSQNIAIDLSPDRASLSVSNGGATLMFGGDVYNRVQPNTYQGLYNVDGLGSMRFTLRVVSPTQMSGEFTLNFSDNGHQCSGTIYLTATHN